VAEFLAIHHTDASLLPCLLRRLKGRTTLGEMESAAGLGFFQSDDVLVRKRPLASLPTLEKLTEGVESEAAVIATGSLTRAFAEESTFPLRFKRWLFAFGGNPVSLGPAHASLRQALPDSLRRAAGGESAAEAIFLTFLSRLRDAGHLDNIDVSADAAAKALGAAVGAAERAFEQDGKQLPPLAALATNGRVIAAVRRGHPLWVTRIDGLDECARCEIGPGAKELDPRTRAHRAIRAVVVVSGPQPNLPEREVAEGEIVVVPRSLEIGKI
jgi:hypothetical protein